MIRGSIQPSRRPVRKTIVKGKSVWRIPDVGPVIPRLQVPDKQTSAIGFHVQEFTDEWEARWL